MTIQRDDITILDVTPVADDPLGARWRLRFASPWTGWAHQLYLNGRLEAVTAHADQREFLVSSGAAPARAVVLACCQDQRYVDQAAAAEIDEAPPSLVRRRVPIDPAWRSGDLLRLRSSDAVVAVDRPIAPGEAPRWGFGDDLFGAGGFGYDGCRAPGAGLGEFGRGMLGFDGRSVELEAPLPDGRWELSLSVRRGEVESPPTALGAVVVHGPPAPPGRLTFDRLDPQSNQLTFTITED